MNPTVYVLLFNSEILFTSYNLTVLHRTICNRCASDGHRMPEQYATARRYLLAENKYVHEPVAGYTYKIIERQLIKKPVQHKLTLFSDTPLKQIDKGEPLREG